MYLKTKIGPRAGEILDFSPEAARAMLADGRATKAFPGPDDEREPEPAEAVLDPTNSEPLEAASAPPPGKLAGRGARGRR